MRSSSYLLIRVRHVTLAVEHTSRTVMEFEFPPYPAIKVVGRMFTQTQITDHYSHYIQKDERIIFAV